MGKVLYVIYAIIGLVHLFCTWYPGEYPVLESTSKIALVPILILVVIQAFTKTRDTVLIWVLFALAFSLLGDIFLLDDKQELNFMFGLGSFLVAHVLYGISFIKSKKQNFEIQLVYHAPIYMLLLITAAVLIFLRLRKDMGEFEFPVILYIFSILFMSVMALNRYRKVEFNSFWFVMLGALLFMFSDTLIAFNKFDRPFDLAGVSIMSTYILAQGLIVYGSVFESKAS